MKRIVLVLHSKKKETLRNRRLQRIGVHFVERLGII